MGEDILAKLQVIDYMILTDVVRQDQGNPSFEISEWSVSRLSDKGMSNPEGLWLFSGRGQAEGRSRPWSVVLKIIQRPEQERPPEARLYWKRELLVAQSGLSERMCGPLRAPRFYRTDEYSDCAWIWMEHVHDDRPGKWTLPEYLFAARQLGRWNGANMKLPLPDEAWLGKNYHREWDGFVNPEEDWKSPLHEQYVTQDTRVRFERLWKEREQYYAVLEHLPQVFSYFDFQRRNLFIQRQTDYPVVPIIVIDWGLCCTSALGTELQSLVGISTTFVEWPASELFALDQNAFRSYLEGLREAGWEGDQDLIRLAYTAMLAAYRAPILPKAMAHWFCTPESRDRDLRQFGIAEEYLYRHFLLMLLYWLDCADEARELMYKLKIN